MAKRTDEEITQALADKLGLPVDWANDADDPPVLSTFGQLRNQTDKPAS